MIFYLIIALFVAVAVWVVADSRPEVRVGLATTSLVQVIVAGFAWPLIGLYIIVTSIIGAIRDRRNND